MMNKFSLQVRLKLQLSFHTQNSTEMTLQGLQNNALDVFRRLAQELLAGIPQDVAGPHDLTLSNASHCHRNTLRCLHAFTYRVQRHHLQGYAESQERDVRGN